MVAGLAAALSLVAPWARSGTRDQSSVDLLRSAGVLDVITGWQRSATVATWYGVVVLVAISLVALAWGRSTLSAAVLVPVGPAVFFAAVIVSRSPLPLRWGAVAGSLCGLTATASAILILMRVQTLAQGQS